MHLRTGPHTKHSLSRYKNNSDYDNQDGCFLKSLDDQGPKKIEESKIY